MPSVLFHPSLELIDKNGFCRLNSLVDYSLPNQLTFELGAAYEDYLVTFEEKRARSEEEKGSDERA